MFSYALKCALTFFPLQMTLDVVVYRLYVERLAYCYLCTYIQRIYC